MNAILVSVDFADILAQTLPHTSKLFDKMLVVTKPGDSTIELCRVYPNVEVYQTDAFTRESAYFNKGLALEEGLDVLGREGWMTFLDADVVFPRDWTFDESKYTIGNLYSPRRRMWRSETWDGSWDWSSLPVFGDREWAGFCQIYSAADPVLCERPWLDPTWINGCCDSTFQAKWPVEKKIRPDWEVLHIGKPCRYSFGRSEEAQRTKKKYDRLRRPGDNYIHEKIRR